MAVARAAADAFGLDRVLLVPVGRQALKGDTLVARYPDRLAMVRLACEGDGRLEASAVDAPRADGTANYTVETLAALREEFPGAELFGVVGVDAYLEMPRWREAPRVFGMAEWVVATRPGYGAEALREGVHLLEGVAVDVSATAVRARLRAGLDCLGMVPDAVLGYIRERGLYR